MIQNEKTTSMWIENLTFDWSPYYHQAKSYSLGKHITLFEQEELINQVYVVLKGRIRLEITSQLGEEKAMMIVGRNGIVGEFGLFATATYLTSAVTVTNCKLLAFAAADFRQLINQHPKLLDFYLFNLDKKFQVLTAQVMELSYKSAKSRVLNLLLQLAVTYGVKEAGRIRIGIRFTQQEMANIAGTSRVTVSQIFQLLKKQKTLTKENGYIYLASTNALERLIDSLEASI